MNYTQFEHQPVSRLQSMELGQDEVMGIFTGAIADAASEDASIPSGMPKIILNQGSPKPSEKNVTLTLSEGEVEHTWTFPIDEARELVRQHLLGSRSIEATGALFLHEVYPDGEPDGHEFKPVEITDGLIVNWRDTQSDN